MPSSPMLKRSQHAHHRVGKNCCHTDHILHPNRPAPSRRQIRAQRGACRHTRGPGTISRRAIREARIPRPPTRGANSAPHPVMATVSSMCPEAPGRRRGCGCAGGGLPAPPSSVEAWATASTPGRAPEELRLLHVGEDLQRGDLGGRGRNGPKNQPHPLRRRQTQRLLRRPGAAPPALLRKCHALSSASAPPRRAGAGGLR